MQSQALFVSAPKAATSMQRCPGKATQTFAATNANDDNLTTYWESAGFPGTLTVSLGANANISSVVVKLNPDPMPISKIAENKKAAANLVDKVGFDN